MTRLRDESVPFRARARILSVLGDQLIGNHTLAVFELVKNSYDADASAVTVKLSDIDTSDASILVFDNGDGMEKDIIKNVWLEPASDYREQQRLSGVRSRRFKRLPLGEKGVGRFAVHKLGANIRLVTRPRKSEYEYVVRINWDQITTTKYLDQTSVIIHTRDPRIFTGRDGKSKHGTSIKISALRLAHWRRGEVRGLWRSITAITSPFETMDSFSARLEVPDHPDWLEDMADAGSLLKIAPWRFDFKFDGKLNWRYQFNSPIPKRLQPRSVEGVGDALLLSARSGAVPRPNMLEGIGPIGGTLVAYDRDPKVLKLLSQSNLLKGFLREQGGVRVYRDGIRVHNYGEPNDDWLELDLRRVNRPTERLSRNIVIGAISISMEPSTQLREKTNREGFDENDAFGRFRELVVAVVHKFEVERGLDKDRLKRLLEKSDEQPTVLVETSLHELRLKVESLPGGDKLVPLVDRVEREYEEMRDLLLRAGLSGLNLAVIIHEVERGIRTLYETVRSGASQKILEQQSRNLMSLVESVAGLLRKKGRGKVDMREVVQESASINVRRYQRHKVSVTYHIENDPREEPFVVAGSRPLILNVIMNLIDNAIYWLRVRWPDASDDASHRRIFIGFSHDLSGGPALIVADNGPGFQDEPDVLTRPFFTRRPDGSGLGLYYASLAMSINGGELVFPDRGDVDLPKWANGAVVAMHFLKKS